MKENKSVVKIEVPECIDNAVDNLLDKPTNTIGQIISDCMFLVFGGLSQKAALKRLKYEDELKKFSKELEDKIEEIPDEKRLEPNIQVVCTALDNMRFCVDEQELRNLFSSLIANSINSDKAQGVHPSYGEVIKQLTSFDAKVFKWLVSKKTIPTIRMKITIKNESKYLTVPIIYLESTFDNSDGLQITLDNLSRLKLIELKLEHRYADEKIYEIVKNSEELICDRKKVEENLEDNQSIEYEYGQIQITHFGLNFFKACN